MTVVTGKKEGREEEDDDDNDIWESDSPDSAGLKPEGLISASQHCYSIPSLSHSSAVPFLQSAKTLLIIRCRN